MSASRGAARRIRDCLNAGDGWRERLDEYDLRLLVNEVLAPSRLATFADVVGHERAAQMAADDRRYASEARESARRARSRRDGDAS
jgi:hypothetical protein